MLTRDLEAPGQPMGTCVGVSMPQGIGSLYQKAVGLTIWGCLRQSGREAGGNNSMERKLRAPGTRWKRFQGFRGRGEGGKRELARVEKLWGGQKGKEVRWRDEKGTVGIGKERGRGWRRWGGFRKRSQG